MTRFLLSLDDAVDTVFAALRHGRPGETYVPRAPSVLVADLAAKATDLKKRLWFTVAALVVFRLLSFVPLPGIDPHALASLFAKTNGGVLDFFNNFSGGALHRMSIVALGVMPYITASIVVQLATSLSPTLEAIKKEGESGRKKLNQYTRYLTVFLTAVPEDVVGVRTGIGSWFSPMPRGRLSCQDSAGLWHAAQARVPDPDMPGSKNSRRPSCDLASL